MKLLPLLFLSLLAYSCGPAKTEQDAKVIPLSADAPNHLDIAFYNVENLFDAEDDPQTRDDDFTPEGDNEYGQGRYEKKLQQLSKVIQAMDHGEGLPAIIGLSEVENESVVEALGQTISPNGYGVVHSDSPDARGIDVALLYRKDLVKVLSQKAHRVKMPQDKSYKTRDILYAEMQVAGGEVLHLFVNHWPSRREGQEESEYRRINAAKTLRNVIDNIQDQDANAQIVVLGDFNDYPDNKSISKTLNAKSADTKVKGELINLAYAKEMANQGTYTYKGDWGMLDQAIVSDALLSEKGLYVTMQSLDIFKEDWMMYYDKRYKEYKPNRTYGGNRYYGGFSDHLPILIHLEQAN